MRKRRAEHPVAERFVPRAGPGAGMGDHLEEQPRESRKPERPADVPEPSVSIPGEGQESGPESQHNDEDENFQEIFLSRAAQHHPLQDRRSCRILSRRASPEIAACVFHERRLSLYLPDRPGGVFFLLPVRDDGKGLHRQGRRQEINGQRLRSAVRRRSGHSRSARPQHV